MITNRWAVHRKDPSMRYARVGKRKKKGKKERKPVGFLIPLFLWRGARRVRRRRDLTAVTRKVLSADGGESATTCSCSVILTTAGESFCLLVELYPLRPDHLKTSHVGVVSKGPLRARGSPVIPNRPYGTIVAARPNVLFSDPAI
jgi:hypothetical protein